MTTVFIPVPPRFLLPHNFKKEIGLFILMVSFRINHMTRTKDSTPVSSSSSEIKILVTSGSLSEM